MLLDTANYERCFKGFSLTDCAVRSRDVFYFVVVSDYDTADIPPPDAERMSRVVVCFASKPIQDRWRLVTFTGFDGLMAAAAHHPAEQFVGVDRDAQVVSFGSGAKEHEQPIPGGPKGPRRGGVRKLREFGRLVYASTGYRGLARREAHNKWISLCDTLDFMPAPGSLPSEYGFDDFDMFAADDIYCVGGKGDVWHRGTRGWTQIDFPSNMSLESVCCAGDGYVYIGAQNGSVWKGRHDEWKLIYRGNMVLPFRDMVWYRDRVYCTSDYGLWEIVGDVVQEADIPDEIKVCSGNLSVADGVMLLAGLYGAAFLEGDKWTRLWDTFTFTGPSAAP